MICKGIHCLICVRGVETPAASVSHCITHSSAGKLDNIGALIIRIGFGGLLCYNYNKEPPQIVQVTI